MVNLGSPVLGVTETHIEIKTYAIPIREIVRVKRRWVDIRDIAASAVVVWSALLGAALRADAVAVEAAMGNFTLMALAVVGAYTAVEGRVGRGAGLVVVTTQDGARHRLWMGRSDYSHTRMRMAVLYREAHS